MAAASRKKKKKKTAAAVQTKKSLNVRDQQPCILGGKKSQSPQSFVLCSPVFCSVPNCVLTKELLTDGLKVLVSKEDELLYAARVHSLDLPDM